VGVSITDQNHVALFDDTTDRAFGPIFGTEGDAEDFLQWLNEKYTAGKTFKYGNETLLFIEDPRVYRIYELDHVYELWKEELTGE
jgi:hypothetical protein